MTAVKNFRVDSFVIGLAIKAPVHVATNGPITLSGEQTVNSKNLLVGMRCLVKDQADPIENGIYVVETSAWQRTGDFDGSRDVVAGTIVPAYRVSDGEMVWYIVDGVGAESKYPGVDSFTFNLYFDPAGAGAASSLQAVTTVGDTTDVGIQIITGATFTIFHSGDVENVVVDINDVDTAPSRCMAFNSSANVFLYQFDKSLNIDGSVYIGTGSILFYRVGDAVSSSIGNSGGNISITCPARTLDITADELDMNETPFIDYTVEHQAEASAAGSMDIDYRLGQSVAFSLTENITTLTFSNVPFSGVLAQIELEITQNGASAYTITWPASVNWPGGTAPDLSTLSSVHLVHLRSRDGGTTWYGTFAENFS